MLGKGEWRCEPPCRLSAVKSMFTSHYRTICRKIELRSLELRTMELSWSQNQRYAGKERICSEFGLYLFRRGTSLSYRNGLHGSWTQRCQKPLRGDFVRRRD